MKTKQLGVFVVLPAILTLAILGYGANRYGGPNGLVLRVKAEIQSQFPEELNLPTPVSSPAATLTHALGAATLAMEATLADKAVASSTPEPGAALPEAKSTAGPGATPTVTRVPSLTPTRTPLPSVTPTPAYTPAAPRVELTGLTHVWQIWNNCGPASLVMDLSYFGVQIKQEEAGSAVRPNSADKHAGADELAAYARTKGFGALNRVDGTALRLRQFLTNGLPVIIATWHENSEKVGMAHYRLVTGYDDAKREWILYDSLESRGVSATPPYVGIRMSYAELNRLWPVMNNTYVVVYPLAKSDIVRSIVGEDADDDTMWRNSLARAIAAAQAQPDDVFAQFTLGANLVQTGHAEAAAVAYDRARVIGLPYRMLWYQFGILRAYAEIGRYADVITLTDATLDKTPDVEEIHYWKGVALLATGNRAGGRSELQVAVKQRPSFTAAVDALAKTEPGI